MWLIFGGELDSSTIDGKSDEKRALLLLERRRSGSSSSSAIVSSSSESLSKKKLRFLSFVAMEDRRDVDSERGALRRFFAGTAASTGFG